MRGGRGGATERDPHAANFAAVVAIRETHLNLVAAVGFVVAWTVVSSARAQPYAIEGGCRDGQPNGAYAVKSADGRLRVSGAFSKGRRTGTFLFWAANGARIAVIPYDDAAKSGTVATWYAEGSPRGEQKRKLEAGYVDDVLHGISRAWHANGRLRGEYRYERGELVEASAWAESGARLAEGEARRMAAADRGAAEKSYLDLERFVAENPPHCA